MRKLVAMGTMLVLMLALASPAFAQAVADDGSIADDGDTTTVTFVDASQVQQAVQVQTGDATAVADDESLAFASNNVGTFQAQFNGGFGHGFFFLY